MIAIGNVVISQDQMHLTADRVEYNRNKNEAIASGNVVFKDNGGNIHYTDKLILEENFSKAMSGSSSVNLLMGHGSVEIKSFMNKVLGQLLKQRATRPVIVDFLLAVKRQHGKSIHQKADMIPKPRRFTMKRYDADFLSARIVFPLFRPS